MNSLSKAIRQELSGLADEKLQESAKRYFREPITLYGIKAPVVREIAARYWKTAKLLTKEELFALCEELYARDYFEEASIAALWLPKIWKQFEESDFETFSGWIDRYINNWAKCDGFCNHTMGKYFDRFPDTAGRLLEWTGSANRWVKRAAAVSLILPARRGDHLELALAIADALLSDADDMVQKGYGWLLKEESKQHREVIFDFVCSRKSVMPRTALRYAIELMPPAMREQAMSKGR